MKLRNLSFIFALLLVAGFVCASTTYYEEEYDSSTLGSDSAYYVVEKLRYEAYPVSPGDYFTIWIQVQKVGSTESDVSFELLQDFPFYVDDDDDAIVSYTDLGSETVVLEYKVRVDDDAVAGDNTLTIRQTSGSSTIDREFEIYVEDVQTSFDAVLQDSDDGELSIALANVGQNDANAAIIRIPDQEGVTVSGTNGQMIGNLEQGDYTVVGFEVTTQTSSLILQVDYTDAIGVRRSENVTIALSSSSDSGEMTMGGNMSDFGGMPGQGNSVDIKTILIAIVGGIVGLIVVFILLAHFKEKKKTKKVKEDSKNPTWMKKEKSPAKK